jgi:hypothetical protein
MPSIGSAWATLVTMYDAFPVVVPPIVIVAAGLTARGVDALDLDGLLGQTL